MGRLARCRGAAALSSLIVLAVAGRAAADDAYIRGYAQAVAEREFELAADAVSVEDGVVTVRSDLGESDKERLLGALRSIEGVREVTIIAGDSRPTGLVWLPRTRLFKPLIADPRWPRFAAAYNYYIDDDELTHVGSVSFGESFTFLEYNSPHVRGTWQFGLQGAVFAIFDLDSPSADLINADYFGALPFSYALGNFSAMLRMLHQSSHLGDEFLLRTNVERVNLSYEAIDLLLSYELPRGFRGYLGGNYIFHVQPSDLRPWALQFGGEYVGDTITTIGGAVMKPVVALDLQLNEEGNWSPNVSPRAGVAFGLGGRSRNLQVLLEYFNGKSPNGQFYDVHIQYIGFGVQLNL